MIHLINFLFKALITIVIGFPIVICLTLLSIIFWEAEYIHVADNIIEYMIWKKNSK